MSFGSDQGANQDADEAATAAGGAQGARENVPAMRSHEGSVEDRNAIFEKLRADARACTSDEIEPIENVFARAHQAGIVGGRLKVLQKDLDDATGLGAGALADLRRSEKARLGGVILDTAERAATFYLAKVKEEGLQCLFDEGAVFFYETAPAGRLPIGDENFHCPVGVEELSSHIADTLKGLPLVEREQGRREILRHVQAKVARPGYLADATPGLNCDSGFAMWDAASQAVVLVPHDPEHRARFRVPVAFDPDAEAPDFMEALTRALPDQSARDALQEFIGAVLLGQLPSKENVRRMMILYGATRSGKSTLIDVLLMLIPPAAVASVPPEDWSSEFERARLSGVALNVCTELKGGKLP